MCEPWSFIILSFLFFSCDGLYELLENIKTSPASESKANRRKWQTGLLCAYWWFFFPSDDEEMTDEELYMHSHQAINMFIINQEKTRKGLKFWAKHCNWTSNREILSAHCWLTTFFSCPETTYLQIYFTTAACWYFATQYLRILSASQRTSEWLRHILYRGVMGSDVSAVLVSLTLQI